MSAKRVKHPTKDVRSKNSAFKRAKPSGITGCQASQPAPPTLAIDAVVVNHVPRRLAQSQARPGVHYAAVRQQGGTVTVRATTGPNDDAAEHAQVQWTIGLNAAPNGRDVTVPLDNAAELVVTATYQNLQASLSVWVIWAQVQVIAQGNVPARCGRNFAGVPQGLNHNAQSLGVVQGVVGQLPQAAGRVCVQATLQPAGVHDVIQSRLRIRRTIILEHTFTDGTLTVRHNADDTSGPAMLQLQPNDHEEIFDLDAPNIAHFGGNYATETYINFRQHVEYDGHVCSGHADWQFYGEFFGYDTGALQAHPNPAEAVHVWNDLNGSPPSNPAIIRAHVGAGHMQIPQQARFRLRQVGNPVTDEFIDNHGEQV